VGQGGMGEIRWNVHANEEPPKLILMIEMGHQIYEITAAKSEGVFPCSELLHSYIPGERRGAKN